MPELRRYAAVLVAALLLAVPAPAFAQDPTPTPNGAEQPPLSEEPPEGLGEGEEEEAEEPAEAPAEEPEAEGGSAKAEKELPDTGLDAGLVALLGLGLLASGSGLRVSLSRDGA
jgi:LPXTG-motif cell wall-anchored protein